MIVLDPKITHQTMTGWEATGGIGQVDCLGSNMPPECPANYSTWANAALDSAVELGINRVRVGIFSAMENPHDWYADYLAGRITKSQIGANADEVINDNSDPNVVNPNGFQWGKLDHEIDTVVIPLRQKLAARGEKLHINISYDDFPSPLSSFKHYQNPDEYAEFVLALCQHMQSKYGFVPDSWEIMNEPDTGTGWDGTKIGRVIAATGPKLAAAGLKLRLGAPSTTSGPAALGYLNEIVAVPNAAQYLDEAVYHRYKNINNTDLAAFSARAKALGLDTGMLEWIGATYKTLHDDLKVGNNSAWQQYTIAYPGSDNGARYFNVNSSGVPVMGSRTKFLRQYFKFVRAGANRIEATSNNDNFDPLAFINSDGKFVVIVKTERPGQFQVQGLPAGSYGIKYTTPSEYDVNLPNVTITAGEGVAALIPESGVVTIYALSGTGVADSKTRRAPGF